MGMQQRVEILKMLYRDNEILILDEPTAVLTPQEIDELMLIMRGFAAEGKSILFISHKLNEIMEAVSYTHLPLSPYIPAPSSSPPYGIADFRNQGNTPTGYRYSRSNSIPF